MRALASAATGAGACGREVGRTHTHKHTHRHIHTNRPTVCISDASPTRGVVVLTDLQSSI